MASRSTRDVAADSGSLPRVSVHRITILLLLAAYFVLTVRVAWVSDDAYITFRTVDNLLNGHGLTWNTSERVQTYTHPLWMLLHAAAMAITHEVYFTSIVLSLGISLAAAWVLATRVASSEASACFGLAAMCVSKAIVDFSTSGLENPLTHLLLLIFVSQWLQSAPGARPLLKLAFVAGLGMVNRLDCALLYVPALLIALIEQPRLSAIAKMTLGFAPLLAWTLFSLFYYGFAVPNTAFAKLQTGLETAQLVQQGFYYLLNALRDDLVTPIVILTGLAVCLARRDRTGAALGIGIALYAAYIVRIGGDFMSGRMLTAPYILAVAAIVSMRELHPRAAWTMTLFVCALGLVSPRGPLRFAAGGPRPYFLVDSHGIADERTCYAPFTGLVERAGREDASEHCGVTEARRARESGARVAMGKAAGFLGYFAGPKIHVVDEYALADALLARLPPAPSDAWRIGHFHRDLPAGYFETLESGENRIVDANLARYYDHLRLVISGPLFSTERLREIIQFNLGVYSPLLQAYVADSSLRGSP